MKLPSNVTEQMFLDIVRRITSRIAHKYIFPGYEERDICQESFIIAAEVLPRYDQSKPLENFLYTHISNRLKNFKRDNYYRQETGTAQELQEKKKSILEPVDIHGLFYIAMGNNILDDAHTNDLLERIDRELPKELRGDYLRLKNGCKLTKARKSKILEAVREIIGDIE